LIDATRLQRIINRRACVTVVVAIEALCFDEAEASWMDRYLQIIRNVVKEEKDKWMMMM